MPLLGHHTSGVRKEWYRHDLEEAQQRDPYPKFFKQLLAAGIEESVLTDIENKSKERVEREYTEALECPGSGCFSAF